MNRIVRNSELSVASDGMLRSRLYRVGFALLAAFCFFIVPTNAKAACGRFGAPGIKTTIKLPAVAYADIGFPSIFDHPTVVGLWHVVYTNGADQSTFNDTFDTWHADGTEFESAFLAPAGGDVCVGVWVQTGVRTVKLHHVGWLFNPSTPTATATNTFTLDEEVTVAEDNKSYSGKFTFKVWNLDGTPMLVPGTSMQVEVTGTMSATRITPN
jgi:hypothetical protein